MAGRAGFLPGPPAVRKSDGAERRPRAEPAVFPGSETALSAALSASLSMRRESAGGELRASRPARGVGYGWV